jgi:hypothetical protein
VVAVLEEITSVYPAPTFVHSDNGPDFIAQALPDCFETTGTTSTVYIQTGPLWQNGFDESFNSLFQD